MSRKAYVSAFQRRRNDRKVGIASFVVAECRVEPDFPPAINASYAVRSLSTAGGSQIAPRPTAPRTARFRPRWRTLTLTAADRWWNK